MTNGESATENDTRGPQAAPEAGSRTWGGRRPGAGAPRGNRNARGRHAPQTARDAALDAFRAAPLHDFLRAIPPAMRQLVTIALARAIERALDAAEAQAAGLPEEDSERAQRQAVALAGQLLLSTFVDAWRADRRSRDQREASAVHALRPWLMDALDPRVTPRNSSQSRSESAPAPTINLNQEQAS